MTKKSKRIFSPADDDGWHRNASVGGVQTSTSLYASGYLDAADDLVDIAIAKQVTDFYFFPICFQYRHAMEITLKDLIEECDRYIRYIARVGEVDQSVVREREHMKEFIQNTHSLHALYNDLVERLRVVSTDSMPQYVNKAVTELHAMDKSGQVFRYAWRKDGKASLPADGLYDLDRIRTAMGKAIRFMAWGVGGWLDAQIENAAEQIEYAEDISREYEEEMRGEYEEEMRREYAEEMRNEAD